MNQAFPSNVEESWTVELDRIATRLRKKLTAVRRHLHRHPEPSGRETETTRYLAGILAEAGLTPQICPQGRGAIVDSPAPDNARRICLRGDMDALFIQDGKKCEYRSQVPGVMHACGHDAHSACLAGSVLALEELRRKNLLPWPTPWRAVFQPAEETAAGAKEMIAAGALKNVDAIFALHMDPARSLGEIGVRDGAFTASCDEFAIRIDGRGGHGARPHETADPIAAAAWLISAIYQTLPRQMPPLKPVVASVGQIAAGRCANVIPETAEMRGTLRTLDEHSRAAAKESIENIRAGAEKTTGCRIRISFPVGCAAVINDAGLNRVLRKAAETLPEGLQINELASPSMGSEDFGEYTRHVPGSMFRLGCQKSSGCAVLHSPHFDLDERCLILGARLLVRAAILQARPKKLAENCGAADNGQKTKPCKN